MSAAETLRGRWVRRNVDETLRHVIFDARQNLFMADFLVCGMNSRSLHGTERMRKIFLCGNWMFPAFWRKFLFEFTVYGCLRHKLHRPHSLSEMSQLVSFHISLIVSLSESFCWSVYISVCTCVSLLPCVESRRVVVWALPREVAVHRNARCRALVQTNVHSMP